jgi:Cu/Ag efflux protein CusF
MRYMTLLFAAILAIVSAGVPERATAQSELINGQVTKIDESAGKITIRHGPMPKFDLSDGHTMVFRALDPALLKQVKVGDKIRFEADRINGQFTVTKIQK